MLLLILTRVAINSEAIIVTGLFKIKCLFNFKYNLFVRSYILIFFLISKGCRDVYIIIYVYSVLKIYSYFFLKIIIQKL